MNIACMGAECACNLSEEVTSIKSTVFTCSWKIPYFEFLHPGTGKCISNAILDNFNDKHLWKINLYPDGYDKNSTAFLSLIAVFNRHAVHLQNCPYRLRIYVIDRRGKEVEMYRSEEKTVNTNILRHFVFKDVLIKKENCHTLLPNGTLTLRFKSFFLSEDIERFKSSSVVREEDSKELWGLEPIFNDKKFSDVKIVVGDKEFYVYKGLLANKSPVFAAMFQHDMKENNENVVYIEDFDDDVIEEMLRFIYVGRINNKIDVPLTGGLLAAAEKYEIDQLKAICEKKLIADLDVRSVTGVMILADKYGATRLKDFSLTFFKIHVKTIIKTEEFKEDLNHLASLFPEIIEKLVR